LTQFQVFFQQVTPTLTQVFIEKEAFLESRYIQCLYNKQIMIYAH